MSNGNLHLNPIDANALLEQYKIYIEMADRVSSRRIEANKYYSTILTGLFAALSFVIEKSNFESKTENIILLGTSLLSLLTCFLWYINIRSYNLLNSAKFEVIHELEKQLPFAGYDLEWSIISDKFLEFSTVERFIPVIFMLLYFALLIYSIWNLIH